ncbi:hypothetical protein HYV79_03840 [Candidatus Woesearchaeota archaeon]|nr:hypothetical protein [Candidatus Woesearchaeota archaeon]
MVLKKELIEKVNGFVYTKPRTVQEISQYLGISWVTANRYIAQIEQEEGTIKVRTFRGGTRGALKIAYWSHVEQIHASRIQEKLYNSIIQGKDKYDFSPFDIYQYIPENKRHAFRETLTDPAQIIQQDVVSLFSKAKDQVLIFGGKLSWAHLRYGNTSLIQALKELVQRGVRVKILTLIELGKTDNIEEIDAINEQLGKELVDIRHCEQPLRAFVIDSKLARFKEIKKVEESIGGFPKKTFVFYTVYDEEWIRWLHNIFFQYFNTAIPAKKRLKDVKSIHD